MAEIKCCGDCRKCELLKRGETDPARCASVWGFIHIAEMFREMKEMRKEIVNTLAELIARKELVTMVVPGIADEIAQDPADQVLSETKENDSVE